MIQGFQVWADAWGNLHCADGTVLQARTSARFAVGSGADLGIGGGGSLAITPDYGLALTPFTSATGASFLGGNGRNLIVSGLEQSISGPVVPAGVFMACELNIFRKGNFSIYWDGSYGEFYDGTDYVAFAFEGTPSGISFESTTYGQETYNASSYFTLSVVAEEGTPLTGFQAVSQVSGGTGPAGHWSRTDDGSYEFDIDPDWVIVGTGDGWAEMSYLGNLMAERATGIDWSPDGVYVATAAGKSAYNAGDDWTAMISIVPATPRVGFVYLEIVEASGTVTAVNGPYFGSLPSNATDHFYFPLAESDGLGGLEQLHRGPLIWPSSGGGGGTTTGLEWVSLTMEDYDALDPKDPDTIYDLTDAPWES